MFWERGTLENGELYKVKLTRQEMWVQANNNQNIMQLMRSDQTKYFLRKHDPF